MQRALVMGRLAAAFDAHARLLAEAPAYAAARAVRHDPRAFARALQGHYATDPAYGAKLIAVMEAHDLFTFDDLAAAVPAAAGANTADEPSSRPPKTDSQPKGVSMLTNKWIQFGLSTAMAVLAGGASLDWSAVLSPSHAAGIATGIATVKALLNLLAPGPNVPVQPTGGSIVTHTEI